MKLSLLESQEDYVYRGMGNEEWEEALQKGYVLSDCRFSPYEHQENISCFGDYDTALYYATELPIEEPRHIDWEWRSLLPRSKSYVGFVIEVPRHLVKGPEDDERVHESEYWAFGPIPIDQISRVWSFTPTVVDGEISFNKKQVK